MSAQGPAIPLTRSGRSSTLSATTHQSETRMVPHFVFDSVGQRYQLGQELGSGGQGTVYEISNNRVCKIYNRKNMNNTAIKKLNRMVSIPINNPSLCWPTSVAFDSQKNPIGYLMQRARGRPLQLAVFKPMQLKKRRPNWTRLHLTKLALEVFETIKYLHDRDILIGDINPTNIFVNDDLSVCFVDCDSYQFDDFPCPVGTSVFLPPELQGQQLSGRLRTKDHEAFAIATLAFMMLLPGKPPYSQQGGRDPAANVAGGRFPYPLGDKRSQGAPRGPWRYAWSHLPYRLKKDFFDVFSQGSRFGIDHWIELFRIYQSDLEKRYVSDLIFPNSFKQVSDQELEKYRPQTTRNDEFNSGRSSVPRSYEMSGRSVGQPDQLAIGKVNDKIDSTGVQSDEPMRWGALQRWAGNTKADTARSRRDAFRGLSRNTRERQAVSASFKCERCGRVFRRSNNSSVICRRCGGRAD